MSETADAFAMWAIVELMGHVRIAGWVTEEERFGVKMGRCDIPGHEPGSVHATQYFSGASLYRVTPTTEDNARKVAAVYLPAKPTLLPSPVADDVDDLEPWERAMAGEGDDDRPDDLDAVFDGGLA